MKLIARLSAEISEDDKLLQRVDSPALVQSKHMKDIARRLRSAKADFHARHPNGFSIPQYINQEPRGQYSAQEYASRSS